MKLKAVMNVLNEIAPIIYSESWDNPGLLIGDEEQEIKSVYIAVDATDAVIEAAHEAKADLIVTHHPLIFHPLHNISTMDHVGKRVMKMISYGMSLFAMHTDFDVTIMGVEAASMLDLIECKILEPTVNDDLGIGAFGYLKEDLSLKELAEKVKETFDVTHVRVYGDLEDTIVKVAVFPGSGSSGIDTACIEGCDVIITGDVGHHDGTDALEKGISVIDAGHFGIEKLFIGFMEKYLEDNLDSVTVIPDRAQKDFTVI